ncbi:MAG TPA: adenine methyltransferase [bacterium]|nr:adenine methyltransferase [bacterium]
MKKYQIIYADPPWRYEHPPMGATNRSIENQYPTMSLPEIKDLIYTLPMEFAENAVLFLWATAPKLAECLEVMKVWGFEYRTCLSWDKEIIGMGYWFRNQHELLLVGLRGKFSPPTPQNRFSSVWREKRTKHSKKPDGIRAWIQKCYPDIPKIELFARQKTEGWDVWGNEVKSDIEL